MAKKILIAEDEKPLANALNLKLKGGGFETTVVYNGEDALTALKEGKYDLLLADIEVEVKLYDQASSPKTLIASFEQYVDQRGQTALLSQFTLDKKQVGVNKELLMVMESKGKVLASSRFKILGEGEKFTGKVNFTEDEASGKKTDE